jgi:hypothetical protein
VTALARLVREPLLIFALLAAVVFATERVLRAPEPDARRVEMSVNQRALLRASLRHELAREPSAAEVDAAVERWKLDEVAYREGLKLGLDRTNGAVRELVATAYKERLLADVRVAEPSEAELERFLAQHRDTYVEPVRYDFDTIISPAGSSEAAAWPLFDELVKATPPVSLPHDARRHEDRSFKEVARAFGVPFAQALDAATPGRFELFGSTQGFLVVRLRKRSGGTTPSLQMLRPRLVEVMTGERRLAAAEAALRERAKAYDIRAE